MKSELFHPLPQMYAVDAECIRRFIDAPCVQFQDVPNVVGLKAIPRTLQTIGLSFTTDQGDKVSVKLVVEGVGLAISIVGLYVSYCLFLRLGCLHGWTSA